VGLFAPVVIKVSELMNAATITTSTVHLRAQGAPTDTAATVSYSGSTITLQATAALLGNTVYQVTVGGSVTDSSGNALGSAVTSSFTTGVATWTQSSASAFNAGTQSGTTVGLGSGGVQLAPAFSDDFTGTALSSSAWTTKATGGGQASSTVSGGILSIGATEVDSAQTYVTSAVEGMVSFGAAPYQHFGLATSLSGVAGNSWAIFSTAGTTNTLFARVNANGATQDVSLGALPAGFHDYLIKPVSGGFQFLVDGVVQTTISATFPNGTALQIVMSDYNGSAQAPLQVDWVRIPSYPSTGTFTSSVLDATRVATWGTVSWHANLPAGTTITVLTSSSTDGVNWSSWAAATNGSAVTSPAGRYLRYQIILTTSDPTVTPTLLDISFNWS
jgi:hypothetical protein